MLNLNAHLGSIGITPFYAVILGFLYLFLTMRIVKLRWKHRVSIGAEGHKDLDYAIRAHGNFSEYVPFVLLIALMLELQGKSSIAVHFVCALLVLGRFLHAFVFSYGKKVGYGRVVAMSLTLSALVSGCVLMIVSYFS